MKKKDIKLFDKTIHEVKDVLAGLSKERQKYHEEISEMRQKEIEIRKVKKQRRKQHDKAVKKQIKELFEVVNDLYELFTDLSNGKEYCKHKRTKLDLKILKSDTNYRYCSVCGKAINFNGVK